MPHRFLGATLAALVAAVLLSAGVRVETRAQWVSEEGYDWWPDCYEVPDDISFLPIYLPNEAPDLRRPGPQHRARGRPAVAGGSGHARQGPGRHAGSHGHVVFRDGFRGMAAPHRKRARAAQCVPCADVRNQRQPARRRSFLRDRVRHQRGNDRLLQRVGPLHGARPAHAEDHRPPGVRLSLHLSVRADGPRRIRWASTAGASSCGEKRWGTCSTATSCTPTICASAAGPGR